MNSSYQCKNVSTPLHSFAVLLGLLILLLFLPACSFSLAQDITPPPGSEVRAPLETQLPPSEGSFPLMPPDPSSGEAIYSDKCAPCHGPSGRGDGPQAGQLPNPPAPLGSPEFARQASPANWYRIVTQGDLERFMPPFNSLTDRQRWDVVAYALSLSVSVEQIDRGQELYQGNCASCHGEGGEGDGAEVASLSASLVSFLDQEMMAGKSGAQLFEAISAGLAPNMPAYADQLSEDDRWALVAFLRSLTYAPSDQVAQEPLNTTPVAEATGITESTGIPLATPQTTESGIISGELISATSGGEMPPDLLVTLHGFDQMKQTLTASTEVLPDGTFLFEDVEMLEGRAFLASVEVEGVVYSSDVGVVENGITELSLPIPFYETTTDRASISVDRLHLLYEYVEPGTLRVIELYIISNQSERTVVAESEGAPVLTFTLPSGATNLQFEDGAMGVRYVETPGGFGDTAAIRPGISQHQIVYSYDLPYNRKLEILHPIDLPVNAVVVLIPATGINVTGEQLREMEPTQVQGITYQMFSTGRLEAGSELRLTLSGSPKSSAGLTSSTGSSLAIGLLAFGLVLVAGGVWLYRRRRGERGSEEAGELGSEGVDEVPAGWEQGSWGDAEDSNTLLDAILALDDKYQAGELPEEAYLQRRAELKARLKTLLGSLGAGELGRKGEG